MRRLLIILISMMLAVVLATPVAADTTVVVEGTATFPDDLSAVQAAVDSADQVILDGLFDFGDGTIVINRDVTLRGRQDATILNGGEVISEFERSPAIVAVPPATDVTIRDLTMRGAAYAAIVADGVRANIRSNRVTLGPDGERGILVLYGDGSRITGNTVETRVSPAADVLGIETAWSNSVDIRNNTVEAGDVGILLFLGGLDSTVFNNTIEAQDVGIGLIGVSGATFVNNAVSIFGSGTGAFDVGTSGIFLAPASDVDPNLRNAGNRFRNTSLAGEMVYGYIFGATSIDNEVFIAPGDLDEAIFVAPPFFGLCDNGPGEPNEGGATVVLVGSSILGPAAEGNIIHNRARSATFLDCGINNVVR